MANKKLTLFCTVAFVFLFIIALGCAEKTNAGDGSEEENNSSVEPSNQVGNVSENSSLLPAPIPENSSNLTVSISSPVNGDTVNYREIVSGNSTGVYGSGLHLYVLVNPIESGEEWWIQTEATVSSDGSWQTIAQFGEDVEEHIGKEYRVSAIVTSDELELGKWNNSSAVEYRIDKDVLLTRG